MLSVNLFEPALNPKLNRKIFLQSTVRIDKICLSLDTVISQILTYPTFDQRLSTTLYLLMFRQNGG